MAITLKVDLLVNVSELESPVLLADMEKMLTAGAAMFAVRIINTTDLRFIMSVEALMLQPDVDVRGGGLESQDVPDDEWELTLSGLPLNMVPSVSRDTGLK
ncbi:hypothetical protein DPV78_000281 [Talaromyces pinophilus]|nr:hypothetical protein DPV78_000281 [Talaromyces pinophilus]